MYTDGQVLGASTTAGVAVTALPLTSGNSIFQTILILTIGIMVALLAVRVIKLSIVKKDI